MNFILFDDPEIRINLLPFTFTRPVAAVRVGILTLAEKWELVVGQPMSYSSQDYLSGKFPLKLAQDNVWINGGVCPDEVLVKLILDLKSGEGIVQGSRILAVRSSEDEFPEVISGKVTVYNDAVLVDQVWKIFQLNGTEIRKDFQLITKGRKSADIADKYTRVYGESNVFVEEGAVTRAAVLNAENGPIYIGKNAVVHEGALIRGPFALCEGGHVNMGAKVRGDVTVGPFSKVGGEVSASVIFANSNKAHDGFLGCSVIGEWCNIGADTNTSNLKNNYDGVKVWHYGKQGFVDSGLLFCGLMLGDHSKCAINTMFNTGTVVGVYANVFGEGFPRTVIPSFSWGGASGFATYQLEKAFETADKVMGRRNISFSEEDRKILNAVFELTSKERVWEGKNRVG
jgi:UDP-N-acetylglucosamine diphosphorylase/glucosamine-1-phosphate N-acetyltransferase